LLFSKRRLLNRIKEIFLCNVETSGQNKGTIALRFKIDETTFAIININLEEGG